MSKTEPNTVVVFQVGPVIVSVPVLDIEHIGIAPKNFTHIPIAPQGVEGVFPYRSEAAVAVCLRRKFGLNTQKRPLPGELLVGRIDGRATGLWADAVLDVAIANDAERLPIPPSLRDTIFDDFILHKELLVLSTTFGKLYRMPCAASMSLELNVAAEGPDTEIAAETSPADADMDLEHGLHSDATADPAEDDGLEWDEPAITEDLHEPAEPRWGHRFSNPTPTHSTTAPNRWAADRRAVSRPVTPVPQTAPRQHVFAHSAPPVERVHNLGWKQNDPADNLVRGRNDNHAMLIGAALAAILIVGSAAMFGSGSANVNNEALIERAAVSMREPQQANTRRQTEATNRSVPPREPARGSGRSTAIPPQRRSGLTTETQAASRINPLPPPPPMPASTSPGSPRAPSTPAAPEVTVPTAEPVITITVGPPRPIPDDPSRPIGRTGDPLPPSGTITHIVKKGDTLWDICALYLGDPFRYPEVAQLSGIRDPHWIEPGDIVRIVIK